MIKTVLLVLLLGAIMFASSPVVNAQGEGKSPKSDVKGSKDRPAKPPARGSSDNLNPPRSITK